MVIVAIVMTEGMLVGVGLITTFSVVAMGMRPSMGVEVLDAAMAVALASERLIPRECPIRHGNRLPARNSDPTVRSFAQVRLRMPVARCRQAGAGRRLTSEIEDERKRVVDRLLFRSQPTGQLFPAFDVYRAQLLNQHACAFESNLDLGPKCGRRSAARRRRDDRCGKPEDRKSTRLNSS